MDYQEIMDEIAGGLTGNLEEDLNYLARQQERYMAHPLSAEILGGIYRLIYKMLPEEGKESFIKTAEKEQHHFDAILLEARYRLMEKDLEGAERLIECIMPSEKISGEEGSHCLEFDNALEYLFYVNRFGADREIEQPALSVAELYLLYAYILIEKGEFEKAFDVIDRALERKPLFTDIMFEKAEIYKLKSDMDGFFRATVETFPYCYRREDIARYFRNLGYFFIEKEDWPEAMFCYIVSTHWHPTEMAESQMFYITSKSGYVFEAENINPCRQKLEEYGAPFYPEPLWVSCSIYMGDLAKQEKEYEGALSYYSVAYDLTEDNTILAKMEECRAHLQDA